MNVLSLQVLSLNKVYQPLGLISLREAIDSVFNERAEIVEEEDSGNFSNHCVNSWMELSSMKRMLIEEGEENNDIWVNWSSPSFIAPRVIRFLNFDKTFIKKVKFSRKNILARDHNKCIYCNKKYPIEELQLEHIVPKSRGGKTTWTNTATACYKCNVKKGNRTPEEIGMKLHWKPVRPKFLPKRSKIIVRDPRYKFWEQFISDMYWSCSLED